MTKKSDTPAIRFKGFTDTWEQRKLGEVGETYTGLSGKSKDDFGHGSGKFITYMNVFSNPVASSNMTEAIEIDDSQNKVQFGDVLFTTSSETPDEVGMSSVWLENAENTYLNSFCFGYRPTTEYNPYYLAYMLRSSSMRKKITFLAQGISRYNISKNKMMDIEMPIPSIDEQKQIGEYFRNLDNLITLHQRKYDKLTNVKKSMLEKMFPKNGSNVPEIRFKGFTEAWEQRKFSELYEKVSRKNDLTYGKDDIISVANMYFKEDSYITDESYLLTYNIFELGDIAFEGNKSKNYAHGRFVENTIGNGIVSHVFDVFKPIMKPYDLQFWKYAINNEQLMGGILLRSTKASTMMTNLVANDFLQETFLTPTYPEQKKIGAFFQQLDNLITLHQRELEKLKNIKKSCLENMFV